MIDNCISLIRKSKENKARESIYHRYMADSFKTLIEAYYVAHKGNIDFPRYKDFDTLMEEHNEPQKEVTAEDIKHSIIKKLNKIGKNNGR